jgi:beta propeller repeat protein
MIKKTLLILSILSFILIVKAQIAEVPITTEGSNQDNPSIYGTIVVWEDNRGWKVFGPTPESWSLYPYSHINYCDISHEKINGTFEGTNQPVPIGPYYQHRPMIYKKIIVWEEEVQGNNDSAIFAWDIETGRSTKLSKNSNSTRSPYISGNIIVWEATINSNAEICGYDIGSDGEFETTDDNGEFQFRKKGIQIMPLTNGKVVIWVDDINKDNNGLDIYGIDPGLDMKFGTSDDNELTIVSKSGDQFSPAIFEDTLIWVDNRDENNDIYGCYLPSCASSEFRITGEKLRRSNPFIYKNIIIWIEDKKNVTNIFGMYAGLDGVFGTSDDKPLIITSDEHPKSNPKLFEDTVVWVENKYNNNDIYSIVLDDKELLPSPITTEIPQVTQTAVTPTTTILVTPPSSTIIPENKNTLEKFCDFWSGLETKDKYIIAGAIATICTFISAIIYYLIKFIRWFYK